MNNERITSGSNWKKLPRYAAIGLIIAVVMLLMVRLLDLLMIWGLYSWFFQSLIRVGGINEYIAGAASVLFTAVVLLLLPIALFSFFFRRQIKGLLIVSVCFSLWFVILFFLSHPREGEYFNTITGVGRWVWFKNPQEKIQILPLGYKFDPRYGTKTQLITPQVVINYEKQLEQERREAEQRRQEEVQRIERQKKEEAEKIEAQRQKVVAKRQTIETQRKKVEVEQEKGEIGRTPKQTIKPPVFVGTLGGYAGYGMSYRFEIVSVERINESKLKFGVLIRLPGGQAGLEFPQGTAYIIDPDGNRYFFVAQENMVGNFPPDVDIKGSITFMAPPLTVKRISLIFQFRVREVYYPTNVIFKNLDLETLKLIE